MPKHVFSRRPQQSSSSRAVLVLAIIIAAIGSGVTGYAAAKLANGELVPVQLLPE
jgi:hypothetical protein